MTGVSHNTTFLHNNMTTLKRAVNHTTQMKLLPLRTSKNDRNVSKNQSDIQMQIRKLKEELGKLKSQVSHKTMYCEFLPTDVCGSCSCVDEKRLGKKYYCDCTGMPPQQDCLEFKQNGYHTDGIYKVR